MTYVLVSGEPASCGWLSKLLEEQFKDPCKVTRFSLVPGSRVAGAHSVTEKLSVEYASTKSFPSYIYWKQVSVKDLPEKASYKLLRDVTSYLTEARFYQHFSQKLIQKGILCPRCYFVDFAFHADDLVASQFLLVLEDLGVASFKQQHIFFSEHQVLASLDYLASLHSIFWNKTTTNEIHTLSELWPSGTYWTLDKRPSNELQILPGVWAEFCKEYAESSEIFKNEAILNLGTRLINQVEWVNNTRKEIATPLTLVHGDFKSANIFFKEDSTTQAIQQVSVIDWQWCGTGLGISDVMYLVLGTYNLGLHNNNFALEKKLIAYYCEKLASHGILYSLETAIRDFRFAAIDFARVILAYFFKSYTPQSLSVAIKDPGELTHTSSLPYIVDLLLYLDQLLSQLEVNGKLIIQ